MYTEERANVMVLMANKDEQYLRYPQIFGKLPQTKDPAVAQWLVFIGDKGNSSHDLVEYKSTTQETCLSIELLVLHLIMPDLPTLS